MENEEIAKEITIALVSKLNVVNLNEVEDAAKKVGKAYKDILAEIRSSKEPPGEIEVTRY